MPTNLEIVQELLDSWRRRDHESAFAHYDPDIEWHTPQISEWGVPDADPVYRGHDGVRRYWRLWLESWQDVNFEKAVFTEAGDHVVMRLLKQHMVGRASGVEVVLPEYFFVWTLRDGKVIRVRFFQTRDEAWEAAGLTDPRDADG